MKNKSTSVLLMISSIFWILVMFYDIIYSFIEGYFYYNVVGNILNILMLIVPVSLLILSINLNKLTTTNHQETKSQSELKK
jgi:uncharacterized membrane protein